MSMNELFKYLKSGRKYHNGTVNHNIVTKPPLEVLKLRQTFTEDNFSLTKTNFHSTLP